MKNIILLLILCSLIAQKATASEVNFDQYVKAIYLAEGGKSAQYPYGIRSIPCDTKESCRRICFNTVRNNYSRWLKSDQSKSFLEFLASKYCPVGAKNDPENLNQFWISNVQHFLNKG